MTSTFESRNVYAGSLACTHLGTASCRFEHPFKLHNIAAARWLKYGSAGAFHSQRRDERAVLEQENNFVALGASKALRQILER